MLVKYSRNLIMSDGQPIFTRIYQPEQPIGNFYILHGMGEHGDRYDAFAQLLCKEGYQVVIHDHRGHGKTAESFGKFGHFCNEDGFERVVQDVYEVMNQTMLKELECVIFGHSMGSFIARRFIQLHSSLIHQCILCGTGSTKPLHYIGNALAKTLACSKGKEMESKWMNKLTFSSFNKPFKNSKTPFDWLSSNEKEVERYLMDPYCGFIPTHQFFADITDGLLLINRQVENRKIRRDLPVLLISGSADPVGDNGKGVFKVAKQLTEAGLEKVTVYLFEDMRHEILNEKNNEAVYDVILRWLKNGNNKTNRCSGNSWTNCIRKNGIKYQTCKEI